MKKVIACILIAVCFCMPLLACSEKNEDVRGEPFPIDDARHDSIIAVANQAVVADVETTWNGRVEDISYEISELASTAKKGSEEWERLVKDATEEEKKSIGDLEYYEGKYYRVTGTVSFVCVLSGLGARSCTASYEVRLTYEDGEAILESVNASLVLPY